jgi:hypothetical protein
MKINGLKGQLAIQEETAAESERCNRIHSTFIAETRLVTQPNSDMDLQLQLASEVRHRNHRGEMSQMRAVAGAFSVKLAGNNGHKMCVNTKPVPAA